VRSVSLIPIAVTVAGLASFSVMDGVMKAASIAVGPYSAMFWRNLFGVLVMTPIWALGRRRTGGRWLPTMPVLRLHAVRSATAGVMAGLFFYGTIYTPLAEAMALSFIAPLIALFLAAAFLGERIERRAYFGSVLALAGVGAIAAGKFGGHYSPAAVRGMGAILTSAVLYAMQSRASAATGAIGGAGRDRLFQTCSSSFCLRPARGGWRRCRRPMLHSAGVRGDPGGRVAHADRVGHARAEAQVLVPLEYTAFIWRLLVGWLLFAGAGHLRTLAVALIVTGCLVAISARAPVPMATQSRMIEMPSPRSTLLRLREAGRAGWLP
jgi:S-adenosylmethionine uptake transporter